MENENHKLVLNKRLRPLYVAAFFQGFVFWYAIEKLFMTSIGFNAQTIAIETMIFTVVMLLVNIPMGVLADRWSRKGVLMLATGFLVINSVLAGVSHDFWSYTISICFWGVYYATYLGCYDSVVYDTVMEETGKSHLFEHFYGRVQLFDSVALVVSSLLSGLVVHFASMRMAYFLTVPISLLALPALYKFKEPLLHKKDVSLNILPHLKQTMLAVVHKGQIFWIVLCLILLTANMRILFEFDQLWLVALALPVVAFGPINALLLTSTGSGGVVAKFVKKRHSTVALVGLLVLIANFALFTRSLYLIVLAQLIALTGVLIINIIVGRYLHDTMPSKVRAGASSVVTTIGYVFFLPVAYLFGLISKRYDVFRASWVVVALSFATLVCLAIILRYREQEQTAL